MIRVLVTTALGLAGGLALIAAAAVVVFAPQQREGDGRPFPRPM